MRKYQNSIILILGFGVGLLVYFVFKKETETSQGKIIEHYRDAEVINPAQGPQFDPRWFDSKYQVVVYDQSFSKWSFFSQDWNLYFQENPEVAFIFYYSGEDKSKLMSWMRETGFNRPVLYDPSKVFYSKNVIGDTNGIVFNVKDGRVQFLENPTFPNYQELLDTLQGD